MSESVLQIYEDHVLPPFHPVRSGPGRHHRTHYEYPNGSMVVICGLDNPDRIMSTEYDVAILFEATEGTIDDWEKVMSRMRNVKIPHPCGVCKGEGKRYKDTHKNHKEVCVVCGGDGLYPKGKFLRQGICDCNPAHATHWLNMRAKAGVMKRLLSRHDDNPACDEEYLDTLRSLTGVRKERLLYHRWVSAEGCIWEPFDTAKHCITGDLEKRKDGFWHLNVHEWKRDVTLKWFFASVDWGFQNPGSMLVWGVDGDRRAFCVHEVYMTQKNTVWWAEKAESLRKKYDIQRFVCDPAEPGSIDLFNDRMGKVGGYWIAQKADNDFLSGTSVVRERMVSMGIFFLWDCLEEEDPELVERKKPTGVIDEIPSYVYKPTKDEQRQKEEAALNSDDHGCDSTRYACKFLDGNDWAPGEEEEKYPAMSYGAILGHQEVQEEYLW
jgi:phage terminase large subunit